VDWRAKRPILTRATAHISIIALALTTIALGGVGIPTPRAAVGSAFEGNAEPDLKLASPTELGATPPPAPLSSINRADQPNADRVARLPILHTTIPDRPRVGVETYIVQEGDTIFDIAVYYELTTETIVWSNREGLQDAPWLIRPGLELFVPPVDGVYHVVRAEETVTGIADAYGVEPAALYNEWNALEEGEPLYEGLLLVVVGGQGEEVVWTPPQPAYPAAGASQLSWGVCGGMTVTGPGANGWFIYPTGSSRVSGWYFRDVRNPGHIGLDYTCGMGDPIYAADNGVVTIAGWNGGYGILVEVNHGNGFITRYGHFSDIIVGCGQEIYQGQLLGYCGSTGYSSGAHLHYEIRYNGAPKAPQAYLP
jgi:murein DD-endopeptidase MepM/ murein hydrolase activator NlpD